MTRSGTTQHFLLAVTVLVLGLAVQTARAQISWTVAVNVAEAGGTSADMNFGVHPDATDGLDDGTGGTVDIDEAEAPPRPPAGAFDARWIDLSGAGLHGFLHTNLVAGTGSTQHTMQLEFTRAAGGDITITWDMALLALVTTSATISDLANGFFVPSQDMRTTSTVTITDMAATGVKIVFTTTPSLTTEAEVLTFSTYPGTVTSGAAFTVGVHAGDIATATNQASATITLSQASGAGVLSAPDGGLTATTNAFGEATFSGLSYTAAVDGESFMLAATTSSNTPGTTYRVVSDAGTADVVATGLAFTTQPASSTSGNALGTQPVVTARDRVGSTDTDFVGSVALTTSAAGTLRGTATVAAVAGVATFADVSYTATRDEQGFTLTAASAGLTSATSRSVTSDVVATELVFTTQPAQAFNKTPMFVQPVVTARNPDHITDTGFTETVTLTGNAITGSGTLNSTAVAAVAGVATFMDVQYDVTTDGDTFSLTAASAGLTAATSATLGGSILPAPILTPVTNAGENRAPLLSWSAVAAATSYELDFGVAPACTNIESALRLTVTPYQSGELAGGTYCWRVRSVGANGNLSSASATDTFVTTQAIVVTPEPADTTALEPADTTVQGSTFALDFDPSPGDQQSRRIVTTANSTIDIQLVADSLPELRGWIANLELSAGLRFIPGSFRAGSFLPGLVAAGRKLDNRTAVVGGQLAQPGPGRAGGGDLGTLSVELVAPVDEPLNVSVAQILLYTASGDSIQLSPAIGAQIELQSPEELPDISLEVDVDTPRVPGAPYETVGIRVLVSQQERTRAWGGVFEYDTDVATYLGFEPGDFITRGVPLIDEAPASVSIAVAALGVDEANLERAGAVGTLSFALLQPGRTEIRLVQSRLHRADGITIDLGDTLSVILRRAAPEVFIDLDPSPQRSRQTQGGLDVGDRVTAELHIRNGGEITGWSASLGFDPELLRYVEGSLVFSDLLPDLTPLTITGNGFVSAGGAVLGATRGVQGDGRLARLELELLRRFQGSAELSLDELRLRRADESVDAGATFRGATLWTESPPTVVIDVDPTPGDQGARLLVTAEKGRRIQLQLHMVNMPPISGWSARCEFEPDQLDYVHGSFAPSGVLPGLVPLVSAGEGFVEVGGVVLGDGPDASGNGELGMISFELTQEFSGLTSVVVSEARLRTADGIRLRLEPLSVVELLAGGSVTAVGEDAATPMLTRLIGNYPNPFNATTYILFDVQKAAQVVIKIYDMKGQTVRTLVYEHTPIGTHSVVWNGENDLGNRMATGVYLCALQVGDFASSQKMLLLR
jgi:hypothetical protein